jgi:hypothetical protein
MNYSVRYRLRGQWFFRSIKGIKGDLVAQDIPVATRVLIMDDESRIEIPIDGTVFRFAKERFLVIKKNMEREAGQSIVT